jgi:hypothetical protein
MAVAALRDLLVDPRLLYGMQLTVGTADTLDGRYLPSSSGGCGYHAGANRPAVDVNRAGAALRDAAAELRPRQSGIVPDHPKQGRRRIDVEIA